MAVFQMTFHFEENLMNVKGHRKLMRYLHKQVATKHKTVTLRDHFKKNAKTEPGGEYGYEARTTGWLRRKLKSVGHTIPNLFTGDLRTAATQLSVVTATQHHGRVAIKTPRYSRKGTIRKTSYARRQELEVVAPSERREITEYMEKQYVVLANSQFKAYRRQRIRG